MTDLNEEKLEYVMKYYFQVEIYDPTFQPTPIMVYGVLPENYWKVLRYIREKTDLQMGLDFSMDLSLWASQEIWEYMPPVDWKYLVLMPQYKILLACRNYEQ